MERFLAVSAAAALLAAGALAHAQNYGDIRGQTGSFTGTLDASGALSVNTFFGTLFSGSFAETLILENPPLGANGNGTYYTNPVGIPFPNTGPANDSMLTGTYPLPPVTVLGQTIDLPTLSLVGSFNRNTGAFDAMASAPSSTISGTFDGISVSLNIDNPNITFIGQAISAPGASPLVIQDTEPAVLNVGLSGSALGGLATLDFTNVDVVFSQWDITFPDGAVSAPPTPEPSSLVMAISAGLAGISLMRRRRRLTN